MRSWGEPTTFLGFSADKRFCCRYPQPVTSGLASFVPVTPLPDLLSVVVLALFALLSVRMLVRPLPVRFAVAYSLNAAPVSDGLTTRWTLSDPPRLLPQQSLHGLISGEGPAIHLLRRPIPAFTTCWGPNHLGLMGGALASSCSGRSGRIIRTRCG